MINQGKQNSGKVRNKSLAKNSNIRTADGNGSLNGASREYCKALPNSLEWQAYQEQRMSSLKQLKMKNKRMEELLTDPAKESSKKAVVANRELSKEEALNEMTTIPCSPDPVISSKPAILKKRMKGRSKSQCKDATSNVTWKEPLADTKFLPGGWTKVLDVPQLHQASTRDKFQIKNKIKPGTVSNEKRKSTTAADKQASIPNTTDKSEKNLVKRGKPRKRNNEKNDSAKPIINVDLVDTSPPVDVKVAGKPSSNSNTEIGETNKKSRRSSNKIVNGLSTDVQSQTVTAQPEPLYSYKTADVIDTQDKSAKSSLPFQQIKNESSKEAGLGVAQYNIDHAMSIDNNNNYIDFPLTSENMVGAYPNGTHYDVKALNVSHQSYYSQLLADAELLLEKDKSLEYANGFNSFPRYDSNGNIITHATWETRSEKSAYENIIAAAKRLLGNELNDEAEMNVGSRTNTSLTAVGVGENSLTELNRKNNVNKLTDPGESINSMNQLKGGYAAAATNLRSLSRSLGNSTRENTNTRHDYRVGASQPEKKSRLLHLDLTEEELLTRLQPPKLPEIEVCNVLPGTPEWQSYWTAFNAKINDYYSSVNTYSKQMDDLLVDEDWTEYKKGVQRRHQDEERLKISMGITMPKPPLIRQPLKDMVEIGGYVIRPLGGLIPHANITTCDHSSFRLEIMSDKIDSHQDSISIDTKSNAMTIAIPTGQKPNACIKLVQITVPPYKKVQNLEIGSPLYNGGRLVISGK